MGGIVCRGVIPGHKLAIPWGWSRAALFVGAECKPQAARVSDGVGIASGNSAIVAKVHCRTVLNLRQAWCRWELEVSRGGWGARAKRTPDKLTQ